MLQAYKRLPPPPGYVVRRSFNKPTFYGGAGTLVLTYSLALIYGAGNDFKNGMGGLAVPLLGPWLALGQRNFNCQAQISTDVDQTTQDVSKCITREAQAVGLLVGLGIGQLIGGVLVVAGMLLMAANVWKTFAMARGNGPVRNPVLAPAANHA